MGDGPEGVGKVQPCGCHFSIGSAGVIDARLKHKVVFYTPFIRKETVLGPGEYFLGLCPFAGTVGQNAARAFAYRI